MNIKISQAGNVLGIISLALFILCSFWGVLLSTQELRDLHYGLLQIVYPGYSATLWGFILGVVESYIYGWLIGAAFAGLCRRLCK